MVQMKNLIVLKALSSLCPHSKHLTLNRTDRIIGTRKATYVGFTERGGRRTISRLICGESSGTTYEALVMRVEEQPQVIA